MLTLPQTPSFRLDGRRALVTGASSGIGLGAAAALAQAGAEVTLVARRTAELETVRDAILAAGGRAEACALDITDLAATAAAVEARGPFEVLVNAAGIARHTPALDTTPEDYDAAIGLNLRAVGGPDRAVYCANKHALEGMTKAMALEWAPQGVRVNTLCPTFIRTPLGEQTLAIPERKAWILSKIKLGRVGEIEDLMGPVVFLASDASAMVTGTHLIVDGGWTAE